jgi:hypothetical protein
MYFDPDRILRKSRLAAGAERVPEEGTLFDLLTGEASLFNRTPKPTIYVIEEFVEKLPKTKEFRPIIKKLKASVKAGKDPNLTKAELAKLTRWQVTPSGKLKPIGSTTYQGGLEREVTIAPGEAIKKVKKLGTLKVGNQRIPIYAIKIVQGVKKTRLIKRIENLNKTISELLKRKRKVKTKKAKRNLDKKIASKKKELEKIKTKKAGKEVKEFLKDSRRRPTRRKKVFATRRRLAATSASRIRGKAKRTARRTPISRTRPVRTTVRKTTRRVSPRRITPKRTTRRVTSRGTTPKRTTRRVTSRGTTPKRTTRRVKSKKKEQLRKSKEANSYNVYVKSGGRFLKANTKPLSKQNAQDRASYIVDHSTAATAKIKPTKKVKYLGKISSKEVGARNKIKARTYRIVKGKRVPLLNTIIEKRGKPRINTRGEKRGLIASRLIKQLKETKKKGSNKKPTAKRKELLKRLEKARRVRAANLKKKKKSKRKITATDRKELLKRLEKARAVRMRNLKKRNKK